jgi:hypothetical protein
LTDKELLAAEEKATPLRDEDLLIAKALEEAGLVSEMRDNDAIITPKGRHLLAEIEQKPPKPPKPPLGFLD